MTRLEIAAVLDPYRCGYRHVDFAIDQTVRYGWNVKTDTLGWANRRDHTILVPPITSDEALAVLFHEGGHLEEPSEAPRPDDVVLQYDDGIRQRIRFKSEAWAWLFALNVLAPCRRWSGACQKEMEQSLWSYRSTITEVRTQQNRAAMEALVEAGRERSRKLVYLSPKYDKATQTFEHAAALIARL